MTRGDRLQALIGALDTVVELTGGVMLHPGSAYHHQAPAAPPAAGAATDPTRHQAAERRR